eukprot:CAMPEP_0204590872 /NCGR_PEP_ID=MMETSP0661-20131031/50037_1 /ASSEMBLY_ACC=CAM_ASM_000606 /TAXON_ID=109239 /ORGANISM="Alexandrium margalefi, Strain AMGDE01CS-322" /LENGTH=237 /DNA_ID=CAMNT_0051600941 /DNA_START=58 /DNA_END=771 /DNA_ORIENTATION=+
MAAANGAAPQSKDALPPVDALGFWKFLPMFAGVLVVPRVICFAVAMAIYKYGNRALYDKNIAALGDSERGYLYAAAALFGFLVTWLNNYPMLYKSMVMRFRSGNLRANMLIYKVVTGQTVGDEPSYVVLETDGPVGSYNRANRSLHHFGENALPAVLCLVLAGSIFPFPALAATGAIAVGRILHQVGYSAIGYGGHALGFAMATLATTTLEMLCLLTALKSLGVPPVASGLMAKLEL